MTYTGTAFAALHAHTSSAKSPLPGILDAEPSLHLLTGKPKSGKTTFALHLAVAWSQGLAPWRGAPSLPGSRALIISAEQTATRLERVLRRVTDSAQLGSCAAWSHRIYLAAKSSRGFDHAGVDVDAMRCLLSLDANGLGALRRGLDFEQAGPDPIGFLVLDSLSRLKPAGISENEADWISPWLDDLQALAADYGLYTILIHHTGHANRSGAAASARGSSAIGAVAQVALRLDRDERRPRERTLTAEGNEIERGSHVFEVADAEAPEWHVDYFRPRLSLEEEINAAIPLGEVVPSDSEVARRILAARTGQPVDASGDRVSGQLRKDVRQALDRARRLGQVTGDPERRTTDLAPEQPF